MFVWVDIKWVDDDEYDQGFEKIKHIEVYLGDDLWDSVRILGNVIRSPERQDQLQIYMRDTACIDGSEPNRSIARTLGGDAAFHRWCGGMLAMKRPTLEMDPGRFTDIDTVDFRDVVDMFRSYQSSVRMSDMRRNQKHKGSVSPIDEELKREAAAAFQRPGSSKMPQPTATPGKLGDLLGVRINSPSDCAGVGMFQAVKVTSNDPVWTAPITTVSSRIGLPIRVRRVRPASIHDEANQQATFLHLNADPKSESWGWAQPWEWQDPCGSVLVVHADGEPILPKQVETMCSFCCDVLQPLFEDSCENPGNQKLKNKVLQHLTPSAYEKFCSKFTHPQQEEEAEGGAEEGSTINLKTLQDEILK